LINGNLNLRVLDRKREPILQMVSDKMIPRNVYEKPFAIRLPDRSEWKEGFERDRKGGGLSGIQMVPKPTKALELGCTAMEQDGD
jgi:hypothetical protein